MEGNTPAPDAQAQQPNVTVGSTGVINLSKGAKINLTKEAPSLKKILVGLGWSTNKYSGSYDFDLDASVFMVDKMGRTNADGFVFYNHLVGPNESVVHHGDNKTGDDNNQDAEQISIDLDKVPANIEKIAISCTIDSAMERGGQNFGMVENAYLRLVDETNGKEVVRFNLGEDFSVETAIVVGEVYRYNNDWKFNAVGRGFSGGLIDLCRNYGLDAEYK